MNILEFKDQCKRTCPDLGDIKINLSHMVLGINTEILELVNAYDNDDVVNQGEELADILWYVCNYATFRNLELPSVVIPDSEKYFMYTEYLYDTVAELQDIIKKFVAYNKPIDEIRERSLLGKIILFVKTWFNDIPEGMNEFLQRNINKLKVRYPEKFSDENAINRDLEEELKALKGE